MEKRIGSILHGGTREELLGWLEMMTRRGVCALSDMPVAERALPEIKDMLRGILRKNHGDIVVAHMAIKSLKVGASINGKMDAIKFFFEDLEECLRHRRRGAIVALLVIRSVMRSRGRISPPYSPGALRHRYLRLASSNAAPAKLAA